MSDDDRDEYTGVRNIIQGVLLGHLLHTISNTIMYRRPTLCTLHIAVDFFKSLKIAVVLGGGGGMPNIELHRPGIEPRPPR